MLRHDQLMERKELFGLTAFVVSIGLYSLLLVLCVRKHITAARLFICVKSFPPS